MVLDDHTLTLFQVPIALRVLLGLAVLGGQGAMLRLGWEGALAGSAAGNKAFRAGEFRGSSGL